MSDLIITEDKLGSVLILDLKGRIKLGEGSIDLHETLRKCVERGEKKVLLNLCEVTSIDSSGLGELVAGHTTLQRAGGELKLLHLTDRVAELMMITKLLTVFDVFDDETEAIKSFKSSASADA
jgi:anti-sigma B factor antagonist